MDFDGVPTGRRGLRVSRTRSCRLQATGDNALSTDGDPVPFGSLSPLRSRSVVYLKYMKGVPIAATGTLFLRGYSRVGTVLFTPPSDTYPIKNENLNPDLKSRRLRKQIRLPITSHVQLYASTTGNVEGATVLEF